MQISSTSNNLWLQRLQRDLQSFQASTAGAIDPTGQQSPGAGQTSPGGASTGAAGGVQAAGPLPPPKLASDALGWLISSQQTQPSASDVAKSVISEADSDGNGTLSQDEVARPLGQTGDTSGLSAAFAKLDSDGDGQLSTDELASALQALDQAGSGQVHGHHGHHRHHGGGGHMFAQDPAAATTAQTAANSTTATPSTAANADATAATTTDLAA